MRHLTVFGALTALALASPATARDGSGYIGVEGGALFADDTDFEEDGSDEFGIEYKTGFDLDVIAGYDFGFVRAEGELAWKRASHDSYFDDEESIEAEGSTDVRSAMANVLADFGNDKWNFYAGGGIGYALVKHDIQVGDSDD